MNTKKKPYEIFIHGLDNSCLLVHLLGEILVS